MTDHTTHFDDAQAFAAFDARLPNTVANQTVTMEVGRALLTLEAERDALRLRVAALEGYIATARKHLHSQDEQARTNATTLLDSAGDTTALRAMLLEAARVGASEAWEDASGYACEDEVGRTSWAEAIADRILGASKEAK